MLKYNHDACASVLFTGGAIECVFDLQQKNISAVGRYRNRIRMQGLFFNHDRSLCIKLCDGALADTGFLEFCTPAADRAVRQAFTAVV